MDETDVHPAREDVLLLDCTPASGFSRDDMDVLDRWTPLNPAARTTECGGADCTAARRLAGERTLAAKSARLHHIAVTLHDWWLRPHGVDLEDGGPTLRFRHGTAGEAVLVLCPLHTLHTDVWDWCTRLRDRTTLD
ncbi:hypothetical protein ACIGO8_07665 [Streptomyces sp. NPDC053493]|uniref:hypothetical protein n=1 Tax=Streptomyces sp. NPDC053493 TaxID=3365705 RepID=UPI0037CE6AEA